MPHLTVEELARLVDEPPLPHEAAHVRDCLVCRRELDELRAQTAALGSLADPQVPASGWAALEAALLDEGLMRTRPPVVYGGWTAGRPWLRIAAAFALFLVGGAAGAGIWSRMHRAETVAVAPPTMLGSPETARHVASAAEVAPTPPPVDEGAGVAEGGRSDVGFASTVETPAPRAKTPAVRRAERELADAEAAYLVALQRYAAIADPASGADADTRAAALDRMISTTREALERSPADPVINAYHLAAVREREALRREQPAAGQDWF
jgi:hypothetical protein